MINKNNILNIFGILIAILIYIILDYIVGKYMLLIDSSEFFGKMAEIMFIITILTAFLGYVFRNKYYQKFRQLYIIKYIESWYMKKKKIFITLHIISASLLIIFSSLHMLSLGLYKNFFLLYGISLVYSNAITGILLKWFRGRIKYSVYLIHSQWLNVIIAILFLLIGHGLTEGFEIE